MFGFKEKRRKRLMATPLPEAWIAAVERNAHYYNLLPPAQQTVLRGLVQVFIDEKPFEGCGGMQITDEIRVTIGAQACILLLGGQSDFYPKLRTILVYPHAYLAPTRTIGPDGMVSEGLQAREGESWSFGNVVLSWEDVLHSPRGRNVVYHEFAHQLDIESGSAEGAPVLPETSMYKNWSRVLGREYRRLIDRQERGEPSLLDTYGATSPAEFFAVATECFFERPVEMKSLHFELYEQLRLYYRQDPAALMNPPTIH